MRIRVTLGELRRFLHETFVGAGNGNATVGRRAEPIRLGDDDFVRADDASGARDTTVSPDDDGLDAVIARGKTAWRPGPPY